MNSFTTDDHYRTVCFMNNHFFFRKEAKDIALYNFSSIVIIKMLLLSKEGGVL